MAMITVHVGGHGPRVRPLPRPRRYRGSRALVVIGLLVALGASLAWSVGTAVFVGVLTGSWIR